MPKLSKWEIKHLQNIQRYERQIEKIFQSAAQEAASIGAVIGDFNPDKPFSFADYPNTRKRIEKLLKTLKSEIQTVVLNGIDVEWTLANNKNSELANQVFGSAAKNLTEEQSRRYYRTNDVARQAFAQRKVAGLNLSDRVWRYTDQFKEEIEMGLDIGLRDGLSAAEMSRSLRQFLRHPDKLFRRVRDEHGVLHLSKAAKAFHPGQGVYRSSYKNARRLAATETNIAYRTSDYMRWQQLDFVVGIEVRLSNNHTLNGVPLTDICDTLKGKYPKDFKFTGWHPHCRCHAVPILKTPEEMAADNERIMNGEPLNGESENKVTGVPSKFKSWLEDNAERIKRAKTLPYFLADNGQYNTTTMSIAERAAARHAARTPEQIEAIKHRWYERKAIRHYGQNILSYMGGISDVDTSALATAMRGGDVQLILAEAQKLKATGKQILALSRLDNPIQLAREFSMADAIAVNSAVEKKLAGWAHLSLAEQRKKLLFEIDWVQKNQKYPTWWHARQAYAKELEAVVDKIDWQDIANELKAANGFATKSAPYHDLVAKLKQNIANKDKTAAHKTIIDIKVKRSQLEKDTARRQARKMRSNVSATFPDDAYSQERKNKAIWCQDETSSKQAFNKQAKQFYDDASTAEKDAAYRYTSGSGYVNRPLRGYDGAWGKHNFKGIGKVPLDNESPLAPQDIDLLTKFIDKSTYKHDIWLQRGVDADGLMGFLGVDSLDDAALQSLVGQSVIDTAFMSCGAAKGTGFNGNIINIYCPRGTKMLYIDGRSAYKHENEMLIQRNTRFRITKIEKASWGRYYIDVEVIGQI